MKRIYHSKRKRSTLSTLQEYNKIKERKNAGQPILKQRTSHNPIKGFQTLASV